MKDTDFYVEKKNWNRIAEPFEDTGEPELINIRKNLFFNWWAWLSIYSRRLYEFFV